MAGPWEDFQSPSQASSEGPWSDFQASTPAPATPSAPVAPASAPWTDFGPSPTPGITDYLGEVGKRFVRDAVETQIALPLRGLASMPPDAFMEPDQMLQAAQERMARGQDPSMFRNAELGKVTESPLYTAGKSVSDTMNRLLPDRNILNPVVSDVAGGFGSVAGNIATAMIPVAGPGLSVLSNLTGQGMGSQVDDAIKAGATEDQMRRAASLGQIAGATEFVDALLPAFLGATGKALGFIKRVGLRVVEGAFIEGGQEGLQQFIQNAIAKGIYAPKRDLMEDVRYNAMIGAIVGGGTGAILGGHGREGPTTAPTAPTIDQSVAPPTVEPTMPQPGAPPVTTPDPTLMLPIEPSPYAGVKVGTVQLGELSADYPNISPTVDETKAKTLSPQIVDHIQKQAPPLTIPKEQLSFDQLLTPIEEREAALRETIKGAPGANTARLAKLLGPKLYGDPTDITPVSVKEMFQNSFDAIKATLEQGKDTEGNIDINMDPRTRTVSVQDDGSGMTPQVLAKQFLEIAGTSKESKRASGGLGIAKMLFIFGNKDLHVTTMRDGKVAELSTTGEQLFTALDDTTKAPNINVRTPTTRDHQMFPKGRGTRVEVRVPEQYSDPSTGETKKIGFDTWDGAHPVLQNSPLFGAINVRFNGEELALGNHFPVEDYTQFANVKFDWGTARVYVSQNEDEYSKYGGNTHILSNGLWQFSTKIKKDPTSWSSENVPRKIYIDVNPRVNPEDSGYPFDLNRQQFSPTTKKGFENLTNYIGLLYQQQDFRNEAHNFGTMQFLDYDPATKSVSASKTIQIEPKMPPPPNAVTLIPQGKIESVTVVDGELRVNGRKVPDLTPEVMEKFKVNPASLRVDQSEIDPRRVILHDNVEIEVSPSETRSVVDYGREKFGKRFDEYMFAMGNAFKELRDVVVRYMPKETGPIDLSSVPSLATSLMNKVTPKNNYEALAKEGIGISFDAQYRGVSITVPFHGMFLNPVVPEYTDPIRAAVGMVGTMVHELAHHKVRSHDATFPAEMQRILIMLDSTPSFNFHAFKQKVVNVTNTYHDVLTHMNGVFTSGDFLTRPRGKRFEDVGTIQEGYGGVVGDLAGPRGVTESGSRLADWAAKSQTIPEAESGRAGAAYQTGPSGTHRPSDNGRGANYNATKSIDPGISAPPQQPEVNLLRESVGNSPVGNGTVPPILKEAAAHADRYNWLYKWGAGITQLLDGNPYFQPLRKYVERVRQMHSDESKIHDAALRLMKDWRGVGAPQMKALENLILDVQDMPYLTPGERSMNLWRHPTQAEFSALVQKHKVSEEGLKVYNRIRQMDETFLQLLEQEAKDAARRRLGSDPVKLAARIDEIEAVGRGARAQPFFPFTRFGRYYLTVKDQAGKITHFETFEPARFVGITVKRAERYQQAKARELEKKVPPGHTVETGVLPETAEPLIGLPVVLLQELQSGGIQFTADQVEAIKFLQSNRNPAMSLKRRAVFGDRGPTGVSLDLPRSFAKYFFHGGRYYAKTRHSWALAGHIAEAQLAPGNKAGLITSYMNDHLQNTVLDAKGDFGAWKGAIFLWAMGYSVAAATQNMTQTPMITYPFLAAKFGDIRATRHVLKSMSDLTNFYKRGYYVEPSPHVSLDFEMKALGYGIKTGRISETQAPELAGMAGGGKLISGMGGSRLEQGAVKFQEKAAWFFEMAEQWNRRIAYRAALRLAMENPQAKFVKESVEKYQGEYRQLVAEFGSETNAAAVVTAIHSVDQTQFIYARYARSRLFRGPKNIFFVFQQYLQSMLWMLGNNKSDVLPRYVMVAMLMGGLGGLPGYEEFKSLFRMIGVRFFGKDVNLDKMIRDHILQWFDGRLAPDLVLHGLARRGFGLPALVDMMGGLYTGNPGRSLIDPKFQHSTNIPFPVLDRSRAIGVNHILPVDIGKMFTPTDKLDKVISDQAQQASGAFFGVGFNLYKAIMDSSQPGDDRKRWEKAMPRAFASASRAYRAFDEGRERSSKGGPNSASTVVTYDRRDTEQLMEIIALGLGYQPLRQQAKWDSILAQTESKAFYDMKRKDLLEEYYEALKGRDPKEIAGVKDAIIKFNTTLPDFARGKALTGDTIQRSMGARERSVISREIGVPITKSDIGISREMQRLFPEATIDVRRVR
jgi:hypothetical protein